MTSFMGALCAGFATWSALIAMDSRRGEDRMLAAGFVAVAVLWLRQ